MLCFYFFRRFSQMRTSANRFFTGLSVFAIVASVLISMESGTLMTMIILGSIGLASFQPEHLIGVFISFFIVFVLGNLGEELRNLLSVGTRTLILFCL